MSPFKQKVIEIVRMVPDGKVVSYSQVALYCGLPRAARQVGWILNSTEAVPAGRQGDTQLPWWRVVNNKGRITIKGTKFNDKEMQKKLLEAEGLDIADDFTFDMEKYRFVLPEGKLKGLQLSEEYIRRVIDKYGI